MSDIEWLIKYEREGTKLDFKKEQYQKEKYQDLIKDIMSMANTPIDGKRYIIVGVKDKPDGTKEYFSIPREEIVDQATYQQILRENVEPNIDFSYYSVEINDNVFGVFEIDNCNNPPYMMKKDYKGMLKKGECFIRKGSQQERIIRRDLDEILKFKTATYFNDKISIGFNKNLDQKITVKGIREVKLPSKVAKEKIESILQSRNEGGNLVLNNQLLPITMRMSILDPFKSVPYEERSTEKLIQNLEDVMETYNDNDWYYIGEEMSEKINLTIRNDGNKYLEDVSIELRIPNDFVKVMDRVYSEPKSGFDYLSNTTFSNVNDYYPDVIEENEYFVIREDIGALKHQQYTEAFNEKLRVYFGTISSNQNFNWSYTIFAKNLPNPITGVLKVDVV
ncbi:helix-turn-helix domain-containing protein [Psychrobacillus antarcticus]|uniref:AlbA family DNA-binding domain-containing protein n=1 Tax=Psychrobacillus antarcticus TaxID=2879115 RepID=UPI0024079DFE|nr:ATP-binding protein [Psychrobacillus antarcticus]